jgi:H+-transporting ATPase
MVLWQLHSTECGVENIHGLMKALTHIVASGPSILRNTRVPADDLEKKGFRVLAVAAGTAAAFEIIGLIALSDPPRPESVSLRLS